MNEFLAEFFVGGYAWFALGIAFTLGAVAMLCGCLWLFGILTITWH